jgi:hypothetical protein
MPITGNRAIISQILSLILRLGLVFLALSGPSMAGVLGSVNVTGWSLVIGEGVLSPSLNLRFAVSASGGSVCWISSPPSCYVLLDQVLTPADIGETFVITAVSNPDFQGIVTTLTDGIDNEWSFSQFSNLNGGIGFPVSAAFPNGGGPDFLGDTVTEVDLTINDLVFRQVTLPSSLTTFDVFTEARPDVTISVQGSNVPEPRPLPLLMAGSAILSLFRKMTARWKRS